MDTIGAASGMVIDIMLLVCLIVAISVGTVLLWQVFKLRRERFKFDQMIQSLAGQMSIFQSTMESGKDDIEVKIARLNKIVGQGRDAAEELRILIEASQNARATIRQSSTPPAMQQQPQQQPRRPAYEAPPAEREERRPMFAIVDPEFTPEVKEDAAPAVDDFGDLSPNDRAELAQLSTHAEKALMAALKRAGRR